MADFIKRTGLFLQARLNSKRMPGKSLLNIGGKPLIVQCMERLQVVPADCRAILTTKESEQYFKPLAEPLGWEVFVGEEQNVLKRFVDAAYYFRVNTIIRATADNPLLSSEIASETLDLFNKGNCDLAYLKPVPYGSGVEVVSANVLNIVLSKTTVPYHLEHVTPYIYDHKEIFKIREGHFTDEDVHRSDVRLTVDTREDYEKMNHLFRELNKKSQSMKIKTVIGTYDQLKFIKYRRILFITAFSDSYGMGHLQRISLLSEKLKRDFNINFSFKHGNKSGLKDFKKSDINFIDYGKLTETVNADGAFDRVIVDLRDTPPDEMKLYKTLGPVMSIDDMGQGGKMSDINVKTLPSLPENNKSAFNFDGIEYLMTDTKKDRENYRLSNPPKNVLVTFGGSDPGSLTVPVATCLSKSGYNVTVVIGPYFKNKIEKMDNCKIIRDAQEIDEHIKSSDLVVTSFGMTFFESLILEKPVLIINPSVYHDGLTENFSYPYYVKRNNEILESLKVSYDQFEIVLKDSLEKMIKEDAFNKNNDTSVIKSFFSKKIGTKLNEIINFIKKWSPSINICPHCSTINDTAIYRSNNFNMVKCKKCSLTYLIHFEDENKNYEKEYFLEEYEKSYGRTYEDDKNNIKELSGKRLDIIGTYIPSGTLLDFGSGLGFFADSAESRGFKTLSMDVSKYATDYIKNKLKLNSIKGSEYSLEKDDNKFDVITSFYVIEHIRDFKKLLFLFTNHLKKYGVLALSTPNADGISIKKNFSDYSGKHPEDHNYIFSPGFLEKLLKDSGYTNIKINITGIHPDRFTKSEKLVNNKYFIKFIHFYARIFKLGDTFEIYAQKK